MVLDDTYKSKTSQLVSTLIPKGEIDKDKEYLDVSKCYIAFYKYRRVRKRKNGDKEYNFDIFKEVYNVELGKHYKSIDNQLVGIINSNGDIKVREVNDRVNCYILSVSKFDSVRLLMYNSGLIKAYVPGKATKDEIREVVVKITYYYQVGVSYLPDDLSDKNGKRRRG